MLTHGIKFIFSLLVWLITDKPGELDFRHKNFSPKRLAMMLILGLSIMLNGILTYRFYQVGKEVVLLREKVSKPKEPNKLKETVPMGKTP